MVVLSHYILFDSSFYDIIARLGVPLLLFSSGFLLSNKNVRKDKLLDYIIKYPLRFFICNAMWTILLNIFNVFFFGMMFEPKLVLYQILTCGIIPQNWNSWFQRPMLEFYIVFPFFNFIKEKSSKTLVNTLLIILFTYTFILKFLGIKSILGVDIIQKNFFMLVSYILIGYFCKIIITNICIFVLVFSFYVNYTLNLGRELWYNDLSLLIVSFMTFRYMANFDVYWFGNIYRFISERTPAIFYIHMPIRHVLGRYCNLAIIPNMRFRTIILTILVILVTIAIIMVIEKLPFKFIKTHLLYEGASI